MSPREQAANVGGEPGNGRQAAKVVTVKWGHGAGLRAQ